METPITEKPIFIHSVRGYLSDLQPYKDYSKGDVIIAINRGAEIAQQILSKEHEKDKEQFSCEFAEWINKNYIKSFFDTERWMEHTDSIEIELETYSTQDLLALFIKEKENGNTAN